MRADKGQLSPERYGNGDMLGSPSLSTATVASTSTLTSFERQAVNEHVQSTCLWDTTSRPKKTHERKDPTTTHAVSKFAGIHGPRIW